MKKINNKGYMLVEIIIATVLSLVVAYFLMNITIKMVNLNNDYYVESVLVADKAIITKEIMDDLSSKELTGIEVFEEEGIDKFKLTFEGEEDPKVFYYDNEKIVYGNFTKKISKYLNIGDVSISSVEKKLNIGIGAHTNYSNNDYGILLVYNDPAKEVDFKGEYDVQLVVNGANTLKATITSVFGNGNVTFDVEPGTNYNAQDYEMNCINAESENLSVDKFGYDTTNQKFNVSEINSNTYCTIDFTEITNLDDSGANPPSLGNGLIPVMYYNNNWVVADYTNQNETYKWYDYNNKIWANAVLVNSTLRNELTKNSDGYYVAGQKIGDTESEGVLAFYVWIPRYKYKVWNLGRVFDSSSYSYDAYNDGIDIQFISTNENEQGTISCSYSYAASSIETSATNETCTDVIGSGYYTHPAFTFGDKELEGFWIGKFEVSSSNPKTGSNYGGGNKSSLTARILPNVGSWRYNTYVNMQTVVDNMQKSGNIYGLTTSTSELDSHILKNIEWGAVAYLTNSVYGKCNGQANGCSEVQINGYRESVTERKYNGYYTGCGPVADGDPSVYTTSCTKYTTTLGKLASTTGNIYGVYDMSGGAGDRVMGNMSANSGSYKFSSVNSGFSSSWYSTSTKKYIDAYAYGTSVDTREAFNRTILGDAIGETFLGDEYSNLYGWYEDVVWMLGDGSTYSDFWLSRGSWNGYDTDAGIYSSYHHDGAVNIADTYRIGLS